MPCKFMTSFDGDLETFDASFASGEAISVFAFFEGPCAAAVFLFEVRDSFLGGMMKIKLCSVHNEKKVDSCDMS